MHPIERCPTPLAATALAAAIALASTQPAAAQRTSPTRLPAKVTKLHDNLVRMLRGNVVGYSFAVSWRGRVRKASAGGLARVPGSRRYTTNTRQNVASVTKNITAIAVLQLLKRNRLTVTSRIGPWLPSTWPRGYGFKKTGYSLTFRQLLTHTTGVDQRIQSLSDSQKAKLNNKWDGLKELVRIGVRAGDVGKRSYKNANYALFRIMIPYMWRASQGASRKGITSANYGIFYMFYVAEKIMKPSGISVTTCRELAGRTHAAGYVVTSPAGGSLWNVDNVHCGGHGNLHLSSRHVAQIAAQANCDNHRYLRPRKRLLSKPLCFARRAFRLGWDPSSNGSSARHRGKYWHGGDLFSPKTPPRKAVHSCVMTFPGNIDVAALINSDTRNGKSLCSILLDAYEAS